MTFSRYGLGQDGICISVDEETGACTAYAPAYVEPIPSEYGGLTPTVLTPYTIEGPLAQDYSQILANQSATASGQLDAANATLKALIAAGAGVAQLAVAQSAVKSAQDAVTKAKAAQLQQTAAGTVSGCAITIIPGICNSYVYIGGIAIGAILLITMMKGRR